MLIHGQEKYAKVLVGGEVHTREQSRATFDSIQWIADRRKTTADTEERALQEKLTRVFNGQKEMILKDGNEEEWKRRAWSFGEAMKDLIWFLETVDTGVDIVNYPRTLYQGSLEPRRHIPGHELQNDAGRTQEEIDAGEVARKWEALGPHGQARQEGGTRDEQQQRETINLGRQRFPEMPRTRRPNPDDKAYGGWDVIDHLTVDQCANRPSGVHTAEVIPNSLHAEWTKAWNAAHRLRHATMIEEENERDLKWKPWLPQGLLHAPQRGRKNGARQYRELARRFVM
jgi:hypothetical protein